MTELVKAAATDYPRWNCTACGGTWVTTPETDMTKEAICPECEGSLHYNAISYDDRGNLRRPQRCSCCRGSTGALVVDHDHTTGLVRGWVCAACNGKLPSSVEGAKDIVCFLVRYYGGRVFKRAWNKEAP